MRVNVISHTKQEFNGVVYYLCKTYFQKKGKRLHRVVWEYFNGKPLKGYHIHHIDGNIHNNNIENLQMITAKNHAGEHFKDPKRVTAARENMLNNIIPLAAEWHKSEAGKEFHSKFAKHAWSKRGILKYNCTFCGKEFYTRHIYSESSNRFCHQNCRAKFRTRRLRGLIGA